jgi:uncharacterized protein (DUF2461 family)
MKTKNEKDVVLTIIWKNGSDISKHIRKSLINNPTKLAATSASQKWNVYCVYVQTL